MFVFISINSIYLFDIIKNVVLLPIYLAIQQVDNFFFIIIFFFFGGGDLSELIVFMSLGYIELERLTHI